MLEQFITLSIVCCHIAQPCLLGHISFHISLSEFENASYYAVEIPISADFYSVTLIVFPED